MGYISKVRGEISAAPPLTWGEVRNDPMLGGWDEGNQTCLRLALTVNAPVQTDNGELTPKYVDGVVPVSYDPFKAYSIVEDLQAIVDRYGNGRTFDGCLTGEGSDYGDLWRVLVRDGKAVKEVARVVWPDGTEEPRRDG